MFKEIANIYAAKMHILYEGISIIDNMHMSYKIRVKYILNKL